MSSDNIYIHMYDLFTQILKLHVDLVYKYYSY